MLFMHVDNPGGNTHSYVPHTANIPMLREYLQPVAVMEKLNGKSQTGLTSSRHC